jgi:hypothetical protein
VRGRRRCPHLVHPPLDLAFLRPAAERGRFAIFAASDHFTPCFGGVPRARRTALRGAEPDEILRAQLMGGSPRAVRPPLSPPEPMRTKLCERSSAHDSLSHRALRPCA